MNNLLEKAKRDYPIGTKFRSLFDVELKHNSSGVIDDFKGSIYVKDEYQGWWRCIYDNELNQWAEIIKEESQSHIQDSFRYYIGGFSKHNLNQNTMTQQEFNSLRVGDFISQYEILHKYKEFLIVKCDDGHDLFDLEKINKLGLKIKPKTFMGLEVKKYDNVPCEMDGNQLYYLLDVNKDSILCSIRKNGCVLCCVPTSIRIL